MLMDMVRVTDIVYTVQSRVTIQYTVPRNILISLISYTVVFVGIRLTCSPSFFLFLTVPTSGNSGLLQGHQQSHSLFSAVDQPVVEEVLRSFT